MQDRFSLSDAESMRWPVLWSENEKSAAVGVALNRPTCVVGARCLVHLPLEGQTISKSQALLVHETGGVYVRDLASKNQTYLNGQAVRESWLNPSDLLQFGPYIFRCHWGFERDDRLSEPSMAEIWLEPDGLASRQVVSVRQRTFLIGSRRGCDLHLPGEQIALAHAVIFLRDGQRYLRDLSTITGTTVNGNRIREIKLQAGDEIRVGASRIEYYPIERREIFAETSSDGTRVNFAEAAVEMSAVSAEKVSFGVPAQAQPIIAAEDPADNVGDQIVLPWDDVAPIELQLVDSHRG